MDNLPAAIFRRWIRIPEEDAGGVLRYRAEGAGTRPPLTRPPRPILELFADGRVVEHVAGPADARVARPGSWEASVEGLTLVWDDGAPTTVVEIVACDDTVLELRVLAGALT